MDIFDDGIALEPAGAGRSRGRTVPGWANMVGPFGGITAATLVHAIELQPDVLGLPVALTVNYLAPIADGAFDVQTRAVRTNRSNQHWIVELSQDGDVKTTATAVFGVRRDTWSDTEPTMPVVASPEEVAPGPNPLGVVWLGHYDLRFVSGGIPAAEEAVPSDASETVMWVRHKPARVMDFASLTALCDIFFPRVYVRKGQLIPAGTISFTVYFHADRAELAEQGDEFVLGVARGQRFSAGHFDQSAQVWSRGGVLLATTHQMVYFKG